MARNACRVATFLGQSPACHASQPVLAGRVSPRFFWLAEGSRSGQIRCHDYIVASIPNAQRTKLEDVERIDENRTEFEPAMNIRGVGLDYTAIQNEIIIVGRSQPVG